jgi:hypothetical protein
MEECAWRDWGSHEKRRWGQPVAGQKFEASFSSVEFCRYTNLLCVTSHRRIPSQRYKLKLLRISSRKIKVENYFSTALHVRVDKCETARTWLTEINSEARPTNKSLSLFRSLLYAGFLLAYSSTLKTEATSCSETSTDFQRTTWPYIQEDRTLPHSYSTSISDFSRHAVWYVFAVLSEESGSSILGAEDPLQNVDKQCVATRRKIQHDSNSDVNKSACDVIRCCCTTFQKPSMNGLDGQSTRGHYG